MKHFTHIVNINEEQARAWMAYAQWCLDQHIDAFYEASDRCQVVPADKEAPIKFEMRRYFAFLNEIDAVSFKRKFDLK